jgi:hypothetical protein
MLAWTWIYHERPEGALYDFLMRCSDDELAKLWQANKALTHGMRGAIPPPLPLQLKRPGYWI